MLRTILPWTLAVLAVSSAVLLTGHNRSLAERLGRSEIDARAQREALEALRAENEELTEAEAASRRLVQRLEAELHGALQREQALTERVAERIADLEREQRRRKGELAVAKRPMPEGVRLCLLALRDCLRADGHEGVRFLRARAIEDKALLDVEMIDYDPNTLRTALYLAGRMTASLARDAGHIELRFFDGHRMVESRREEFPEEGFPLALADVEGPQWEARLPYLVAAEGTYPPPAPNPLRSDIDPQTRLLWLDRINTLLARARTPRRLRVVGFRNMADGAFVQASLTGHGSGNLLEMTADAHSLAVEVDKKAGLVQLLLAEGILRRKGGESTIGADGYRFLLQGITPQEAGRVMLGMVIQR